MKNGLAYYIKKIQTHEEHFTLLRRKIQMKNTNLLHKNCVRITLTFNIRKMHMKYTLAYPTEKKTQEEHSSLLHKEKTTHGKHPTYYIKNYAG
jgi:hypothetical protein